MEFKYLELAPKMLFSISEVKGRGTYAHSKEMDRNHLVGFFSSQRTTGTRTERAALHRMAEIRGAGPGATGASRGSADAADAATLGLDRASRHLDHGSGEPADIE